MSPRGAVAFQPASAPIGLLAHGEVANIRATVSVDVALLAPVQAEVLAMVLREAITNITRHARASECSILLRADDGALVLDVEDDGQQRDAPEGGGVQKRTGTQYEDI